MWGVMATAARKGADDRDHALFDGWFYNRWEAQRVFTEWCRALPARNVYLVKQMDARSMVDEEREAEATA